jgi:sec-independent protein translocase protein TatB
MSGTEIIVILLLALVVLGPEKLPDAIRKFGKTYAELKKMGTGFQQEFKSAIDEPMREMRETADLLKKSVDFSGSSASPRRPSDTPAASATDDVSDRPTRNEGVAPADPDLVPTDDVPFTSDDGAPDEDVVAAVAVPTVEGPFSEDDVAASEGPSDGRPDRGGTDDA